MFNLGVNFQPCPIPGLEIAQITSKDDPLMHKSVCKAKQPGTMVQHVPKREAERLLAQRVAKIRAAACLPPAVTEELEALEAEQVLRSPHLWPRHLSL